MNMMMTKRIVVHAFLLAFASPWVGPVPSVSAQSEGARLKIHGRQLPVLRPSRGAETVTPGASITYLASAEAPSFPGDPMSLQSTSFAVEGTRAYVGYAMAGDSIHGAIDFLDLSDLSAPAIVSTHFFQKSEYSDIAVRDGILYAVGATTEGDGGAMLEILNAADPVHPVVLSRLTLGGFHATSLSLDGAVATISVGDNRGIVQVNVSRPEAPRVISFLPLLNSLDAVVNQGTLFVLGGEAATDIFAAGPAGALSFLSRVSQERTPAPGRIRKTGHLVFTNAGKSGLTVLDVSQPGTAREVFKGPLPGTGNGLDVSSAFAFLAQGEAGVQVLDINRPEAPISLGTIDLGDDSGSANSIRVSRVGEHSVILLGDGLGGFKLLQFRGVIPLRATKRYCLFKRHKDDVKALRGSYPVRIPGELTVVKGNAGQGKATLRFGEISCTYRGGSTCPLPFPGTKAHDQGMKYVFESCSNGARSGEVIPSGSTVGLRVNSGSWFLHTKTRAETLVEVDLQP